MVTPGLRRAIARNNSARGNGSSGMMTEMSSYGCADGINRSDDLIGLVGVAGADEVEHASKRSGGRSEESRSRENIPLRAFPNFEEAVSCFRREKRIAHGALTRSLQGAPRNSRTGMSPEHEPSDLPGHARAAPTVRTDVNQQPFTLATESRDTTTVGTPEYARRLLGRQAGLTDS